MNTAMQLVYGLALSVAGVSALGLGYFWADNLKAGPELGTDLVRIVWAILGALALAALCAGK